MESLIGLPSAVSNAFIAVVFHCSVWSALAVTSILFGDTCRAKFAAGALLTLTARVAVALCHWKMMFH